MKMRKLALALALATGLVALLGLPAKVSAFFCTKTSCNNFCGGPNSGACTGPGNSCICF